MIKRWMLRGWMDMFVIRSMAFWTTALRRRKNAMRCSGNELKSSVIMGSVDMKRPCRMSGISNCKGSAMFSKSTS